MPNIVGIRFRRAGKVYYFDPAGHEFNVNDWAVVDTARGPEVGQVVITPRQVADSELREPLKPVLRPATAADLRAMQAYRLYEANALARAREESARHGLPMKIVGAEYSFDGTRLTFFFTAEGRVDFRDLVRDLARVFKSRIELRQVGARDETKIMDGLGVCGRRLCCAAFLDEFNTVSIRMAKVQDLPLNPAKISGQCGRLLCCLAYEEELYREAKARLPKIGEEVETIFGVGVVKEVDVIAERLHVEYAGGNVKTVTMDELGPPAPPARREPEPQPESAVRPAPAEKPAPPEAPPKRHRRRSRRAPTAREPATPARSARPEPPAETQKPADTPKPPLDAKPKRPIPRRRRPRKRSDKKPA